MKKISAPKKIELSGKTYIRQDIQPRFHNTSDNLKVGSVVNVALFDMVLGREAEQWIKSQIAKKRRVFRDEGEKMEIALFSTDVPDMQKLKLMIPRRFPMFKSRKIILRELTGADDLEQLEEVSEESEGVEAPVVIQEAKPEKEEAPPKVVARVLKKK